MGQNMIDNVIVNYGRLSTQFISRHLLEIALFQKIGGAGLHFI